MPAIIARQADDTRDVIEARAEAVGAPLSIAGQDWDAYEEQGRMAYFDEQGLLDLPLPNLLGAHQVQNAGTALAALRNLGLSEAGCLAGVTKAEWPARMQRLRTVRGASGGGMRITAGSSEPTTPTATATALV